MKDNKNNDVLMSTSVIIRACVANKVPRSVNGAMCPCAIMRVSRSVIDKVCASVVDQI